MHRIAEWQGYSCWFLMHLAETIFSFCYSRAAEIRCLGVAPKLPRFYSLDSQDLSQREVFQIIWRQIVLIVWGLSWKRGYVIVDQADIWFRLEASIDRFYQFGLIDWQNSNRSLLRRRKLPDFIKKVRCLQRSQLEAVLSQRVIIARYLVPNTLRGDRYLYRFCCLPVCLSFISTSLVCRFISV